MRGVNADSATRAAEATDVVADQACRSGDHQAAQQLIRQAAEIEPLSADLQRCWRGPFNGQADRRAIVQESLTRLASWAVVEMGTFRGIFIRWLAQNLDGGVFTCHAEERSLTWAARRLEGCRNGNVPLNDSRVLLRIVVQRLDPDRVAFFYLDAHWTWNLPLNEELRITLSALAKAVVMVNDFRIQDAPGFEWNEYGLGLRGDTSMLEGANPSDTVVFVPWLSAERETGARCGLCVIAWRVAEVEDGCGLLQRWSPSNLQASGQSTQADGDEAAIVPDLDVRSASASMMRIGAIKMDRARRLHDLANLTGQVEALRGEISNFTSGRAHADRDHRRDAIDKVYLPKMNPAVTWSISPANNLAASAQWNYY